MTGALQLLLLGGGLIGAAGGLLLWYLMPSEPRLSDVLARLSPGSVTAHDRTSGATAAAPSRVERLGQWGLKSLPASAWSMTPTRELRLLQIPLARYHGEKVAWALGGLLLGPLLTAFLALLGWNLPVALPVAASLLLAVGGFFIPDYNVRDDAKKARREFSRALASYIDLVGLERASGSGPRQSLEIAAGVGDSWVFQRLGEELARTRWSGVTPWESLTELSTELGLPELADLADIMRLSGEDGAQVWGSLRARSAGMRTAMLNVEKARAAEISERMTLPMSLLGMVFLAILITPALLRVMGS